jgi:hypothetical protein
MSKTYKGFFMEPTVVRVTVIDGDVGRPLNPRFDVINHSPTGFNWGYHGSGPSQLAFAILADAVGIERAQPLYHRFKIEVIGKIDQEKNWQMDATYVISWVDMKEHLVWAKARALDYLDTKHPIGLAHASFMSDLQKHRNSLMQGKRWHEAMTTGMQFVMDNDADGLRRWIEGFQ